VKGQGILVEQDALFDVVALAQGQVLEVYVDVDEPVQNGQEVAIISQPEIENKLYEATRTLDHLLEERKVLDALGGEKQESKKQHLAQRRVTLEQSIKLAEVRIVDLRERMEQYEILLKKGLVARKTYLDVKAEYNEMLQKVLEFREELTELPTSKVEAESERRKEQIDIESRIIRAEEELSSLKERLNLAAHVVSPRMGNVIEIFKGPGAYVGLGEPIMSLELHSPEDEFFISAYFPPGQGKRIKKGMRMQVSPSVVKREEYGLMLAEVIHVSSFPATPRGMQHVLGNERLVELLTKDGPPIFVQARLIKSDETFSGFQWTSGRGAPVKLQSGTLCQTEVVVGRRRPLSLVIPYLKRTLLGIGDNPGKAG
jgi:HlyD family secretion protein